MSVNTSCNDYLPFGMHCIISGRNTLIYITFFITNILLLLPSCILVLYLGLQRRWQRHTTSTAASASHTDILTYHMVAMELLGVSGCILLCCSIYTLNLLTLSVGFSLWWFTWYGETFFHVLTCFERYMAVVHPVTYLSLRGERGIRVRNISIGFAWLLTVGGVGLLGSETLFITVGFSLLVLSLLIISFSSLSVLCILNRPGPGEQGRDRERVHQSKHRAFYTIMTILGILLLRCFCNLVWIFANVTKKDLCMAIVSGVWFNVPCSMVIPLLFLHRAGILARCNNNK